jgi:hypothetical protein
MPAALRVAAAAGHNNAIALPITRRRWPRNLSVAEAHIVRKLRHRSLLLRVLMGTSRRQ